MNKIHPLAEDLDSAVREEQLRSLVSQLTMKVLDKCQAFEDRNPKTLLAHTNRLIDKTMEGLCIPEGFCLGSVDLGNLSNGVLRDLKKQLCGMKMMECLVILENQEVDAVIVRTLQAHIKRLFGPKRRITVWWKRARKAVSSLAGSMPVFYGPVLLHP